MFFLNLTCGVVLHQLKGWAVLRRAVACWANLSCLSMLVTPRLSSSRAGLRRIHSDQRERPGRRRAGPMRAL